MVASLFGSLKCQNGVLLNGYVGMSFVGCTSTVQRCVTKCVLCAVKGYLRKGASLVAIKEYSRASDVYQKAIDLDSNCQEAIDAYRT